MKLTVDKVVYGGLGLARIPAESGPQSRMRVFLPFTLPGEVVEAEMIGNHRGYCDGEVRQIDRASEHRAAPPCRVFGVCGGCQLQHSDYLYQVEMKRAMLAESLTRAGVRELPAIAALTGAPLGYRNRVRLQVQTRPEFAMGYRQAKSHRLVSIDHCPIAAPVLERCIAAIGMAAPVGATEIELFANQDESEMLLTLWRAQHSFEQKSAAEFIRQLRQKIPQLTGAAVLATEDKPAIGVRPLLEWGSQSLLYSVAGRSYTVGRGSFFQVNASLLDAFVVAAVEEEAGNTAWDLYAGGGLFSLALVDRFARVLAVESSPSSGRDLRRNLHGTNGIAVLSTTREFLQTARTEPAPDLVVLDPPRAGVGEEVCRLLVGCNPKRVVYVSCDPATLGRDLAALIQSGYRLLRLQLVDMFPQTSHLETIATLER